MKISSMKGYLILGILFALVSVIALVIPTEKTTTVWIGYLFTIIAFVSQIFIFKKSFSQKETLKSKFLGIPIIHIGIIYVLLQCISFIVFIVFPTIPLYIAIICDILILGFSIFGMISVNISENEIKITDSKVQKKIRYLDELKIEVELLSENEKDKQIKKSLEELTNVICYSDPISSDQLKDIELEIKKKIDELKTASNKLETIKEINQLLSRRNKLCRLLK